MPKKEKIVNAGHIKAKIHKYVNVKILKVELASDCEIAEINWRK